MPGPQGPEGKQGPQGPAGPPGKDGSAPYARDEYRPRLWVACGATLDLVRAATSGGEERGTDGIIETRLHYVLTVYVNHDTHVECEAAIGSAQSGTSSTYFPGTTKGAQTGACISPVDYGSAPGGEVGFWAYSIVNGPGATYMDPDNPFGLDGYFHAFAESECSAMEVKEGAPSWTDVKLVDVF